LDREREEEKEETEECREITRWVWIWSKS